MVHPFVQKHLRAGELNLLERFSFEEIDEFLCSYNHYLSPAYRTPIEKEVYERMASARNLLHQLMHLHMVLLDFQSMGEIEEEIIEVNWPVEPKKVLFRSNRKTLDILKSEIIWYIGHNRFGCRKEIISAVAGENWEQYYFEGEYD